MLFCFILLPSVFCFRAWGQYSIDWFTVDGGGGTTSDGGYEISGTIGQPDVGIVIIGDYVIEGGYWSALEAVQEPGAPWLTIELLSANSARVFWPAPAPGLVLQECLGMGYGHWANVSCSPQTTNDRNQVVVTPLAGKRFYRLATSTTPPLNVVRTGTNTAIISWPTPSSSWVLQQCTDLVTFDWINVAATPQVANGTNQVVLPVTGESPWYRLYELPRLRIERTLTNTVIVSWSATATGFGLQECGALGSGHWANVSVPPQVVNERNQVVVTALAGQRFYRLATVAVPRLRIALTTTNTVVVAWPYAFADYALQQSPELGTTHWTSVTNAPVEVGDEWRVSVSPQPGIRFYRLQK